MSRGGAQPGSGRKPAPPGMKRITKGIRLPEWLWDWLDMQEEPRGTVLEEALCRVHKLKPPTAG
jgi:hypothetical protein